MAPESRRGAANPAERILVIDHERQNADAISDLLRECGYSVESVHCGREGIRRLDEEAFSLVIVDLETTDVDGFEIVRTISEQRRMGFIATTSHASTESAIEALHYEASDYLAKPIDLNALRHAVERALVKLKADRFRDEMVSMIAHDIKIPLSSIIGYSSLIFDKNTGELNPRAREFVQTINANAVKVLSLIENFLTSCKIESGNLLIFPREVDLNYILEDLLCLFQVEIDRRQFTLELDVPENLPKIQGDENLLFRALSNVLSNACKFTPKAGTIKLKASVVPARAGSEPAVDALLVQVSNTGPGIRPDELPLVFEKYRRGRDHYGIEGSGIGGYVLQSIVEAHGGSVTVESVPNSLTTFSIFLPIHHSSTQQEV